MDKSRKMCIVAHCFLNANSKVESPKCKYSSVFKRLIYELIERDYGIIQLPCPELMHYGMRRWGHAKEQFDNPFYRKTCRELLIPMVEQAKEYIQNGYVIDYIIGVNGSPSCGIDGTCKSKDYIGEISGIKNIENLTKSITYEKEYGVYMEELEKLLKEENLDIEFLGISEREIEKYDFNLIFK
ncbi:CD3072 family TudS-related putative desulfidase [Hathewaya histolytica]|uniref:Protein of uncharacterized function (DUF523) n=1 Tax=Hathewaya histolytica TaxID=1498 RepID=A0A4V6KBU4_HATHI|nr:CD3072 family TudS-related putative desulfidase [Hathewaya histolytica]VTQ82137.1 Protein of uncharacterised function (DUF523) [Hathewaya histolytica]